jgi:hypothetical protein
MTRISRIASAANQMREENRRAMRALKDSIWKKFLIRMKQSLESECINDRTMEQQLVNAGE